MKYVGLYLPWFGMNSVLLRTTLALFFFFVGNITLYAQQSVPGIIILKGSVHDQKAERIPFATLVLFEEGKQVGGAIGTVDGDFQIAYRFVSGKKYELNVSFLGYEPLSVPFSYPDHNLNTKGFGKLTLLPKANELKEVSVKSAPKVIQMMDGNVVFNVAGTTTAEGLNALELLNKAPGVAVAADLSISLNGKTGAMILVDGRQTYLSGKELAELLKSMSSSAIKSIEIINSPGAKYDAAGAAGIINIKTLKSLNEGLSGTITTGLNYGVSLKNTQNLILSYRKNKLNVYGSYNHFIGNYSYLYGADRIQEGKFYNSFTDDVDKRKKISSRIGADYAIDKNHTVGVLVNGNFIFGGGITDTKTKIGQAGTENIEQTLDAINDYYHQQTQRYNLNLNYKYEDTLGNVLNFDVDYGDFTKGSGNLQSNKYTNNTNTVISDNLYRSLNAIAISLKALKVDYTTGLWKGKVETGMKYSAVVADNDTKFLNVQPTGESIDPSRSNRFAYKEKIAAAYVNYKKDIDKWQLQGGLRIEKTSSDGQLDYKSVASGNVTSTSRNYTNFFPFLSIAVKPSREHDFSLSYSRRIDRPAYQSLNPFIYLLDELSYWQGNPFLKPQLSHKGLLQYVYKGSTIVGLSYTYTSDYSAEVIDTVDKIKIVMIPRNLGVQKHLALSLSQTIIPYSWWNMTLNGTLYRIQNDISYDAGRSLNLKQSAGRLSLQQSFKLPCQLNAEVTAVYNSRRLTGGNQFARANSQVDLGLQRNLLNDKASLRLVFSDIYKGSKGSAIQNVEGLYLRNYSYFEARQVKLSFSYKFSKGISKDPRNRSSALENENGRIK